MHMLREKGKKSIFLLFPFLKQQTGEKWFMVVAHHQHIGTLRVRLKPDLAKAIGEKL